MLLNFSVILIVTI